MDFAQLYLNAEGRISRKTWWLGSIGVVVLSLIASLVVAPIVVIVSGQSATTEGIGELALLALFFTPYRSLTFKRLNDRDRPHWLFWVFLGPSIASAVLKLLGVSGGYASFVLLGQDVEMFQPNVIGHFVNLALIVTFVWMLVEMGFLKGQEGANTHGPDPLENEL